MNSTPSDLTRRALHTQASVVVEACAGSGKTWLLASRIVRLLLEGVAPGEILAITFTRKAAREIEERVVGWLRDLATGSDAQLDTFLRERGLGADDRLRRSARALYEQVLTAQPPLTVNTFHGWFLQLIEAAPLTANLAGATLVETDARQFDEHWQRFADSLQKVPESPVAQAFVRLLALAGQDSAQKLIRRAFDRRSEWLALGGDVDQALALLRDGTGAEGEALAMFFTARRMDEIQAYLGFLESNTPSDQQRAQSLREALLSLSPNPSPASGRGEANAFEALRGTLLTNENTLRKRELNKTLEKRFGEGATRFVELHARLGEAVLRCLEQQVAERALAFNEDACTVFADFLAQVEAYKQARRQIDFADAEWSVLRLLRDEATAAFVQARLDARYRHVLLDEFQDTNPLQWQVLRAWLDAYSDDERPTLFLVGDPKQSIYRFRRAEPLLFAVAADFLKHRFAADFLEQDATRRNALPIVDVVNALFLDEARFTPFREQTSQAGNLPGRVELLPLFGRDIAEEAPLRSALRDPLREAETEPEDQRLRREADALAAKILEITGSDDGQAWQITEKDQTRPARYGDFMLLLRSRTHMATYEHALAAVGIPFDAGSCGGLLTALEIRDLLALLEFLSLPSDNLKLAQTLRSPLFACTDEELLCLAGTRECSWWQRLQVLNSPRPDRGEGPGERASGASENTGLSLSSDPSPARGRGEDSAPTGQRASQESVAISPRLARAARLLDAWQHDADRLPAHDLLDRIYHQGEVLARYRLAVPPALADRVEANLNALLLLALDLDGGRYPSLPRFIDELRQLARTDARDAPDEGEIAAPTLGTGRVRLLTIHGAKGLEAPIVWLLGANDPPRGGDAWDVIADWPPTDAAPNHFSFYGRREDCGLARAPLFEAEATAAAREELNLLYVAITRARQVFIASGIEKKRSTPTAYDLLSKALEKLGDPLGHGPRLPVGPSLPSPACGRGAGERASSASADTPPENHPPPLSPNPSPAGGRGESRLPPVGERRIPPGDAERYGILLHALLERYSEGRSDDADLHSGFSAETCRHAAAQARCLLAAPELQGFFDPTQYRRAWNEVDIRDSDGRLRRIDRLVEHDDAFWVLDYKSGSSDSERLDEYRQQVGDYCRAIASIHPDRPVHGALLFADGNLLKV